MLANTGDFDLVVAVLVLVAGAGWLAASFFDRRGRPTLGGIVACALGGVGLVASVPKSAAVVYLVAASVMAGRRWRPRWSLPLAGLLAGAYSVIHIRSVAWLLGGSAAIVLGLMAGVLRRASDQRAEQASLLLAETQLAREEQARSAALAERARIAREIHDVLAHTLTALSVQLETIDALLDRGRTDQAHDTVRRARTLMREGLAETRRAISALRDDALPLPQLLRILADGYAADTGAPSTVEVSGPERAVAPESGLALYRTAQEAVTNVRKHAPGAAVAMTLSYDPAAVALSVTNTGGGIVPARGGPGYGLTGLRERAELAGGTFSAHPVDGGWRVDVMIPT
jgi:signal transduction histidine kinase